MNSLFQRRLKWVVFNALFAAAIYFGLFCGVSGAARVAAFYIWFAFVINWFALNDEIARDVQSKNGKPCMPSWLDAVVDIAAVVALVWCGWVWSAAAFAVSVIIGASVWRELPAAPAAPAAK